jgi:hypothetical protein
LNDARRALNTEQEEPLVQAGSVEPPGCYLLVPSSSPQPNHDLYRQRRLASLFLEWFHGIDGFENVPLVANAMAGMELLYDLAEARIGEGIGKENHGPEKREDRWTGGLVDHPSPVG